MLFLGLQPSTAAPVVKKKLGTNKKYKENKKENTINTKTKKHRKKTNQFWTVRGLTNRVPTIANPITSVSVNPQLLMQPTRTDKNLSNKKKRAEEQATRVYNTLSSAATPATHHLSPAPLRQSLSSPPTF